MLELFKMDAARWVKLQSVTDPSLITPLRALSLMARHLPLQAMFWYRIGSWCKQKHLPFVTVIQRLIYHVYGLDITVGSDIGGGLYIPHPIGMVIAPEKIGENCTMIANITIGLRNEWKFPRIGNNVFIGAGARVLGGIRVGDNAVIGANAVVIHDVPDGATVVGIPARVIKVNGQRVAPEPTPDAANEELDSILL